MTAPKREAQVLEEVTSPTFKNIVGHLLRRAQQIHAVLWAREVPGNITSPQYAVLITLSNFPGIDQISLSRVASLDRSTTADLVRRLVERGLIDRTRSTEDTRKYVLRLRPEGVEVLREATPPALDVNDKLLDPLTTEEAETLLRLLRRVVEANDATI